MKKIFDEDDELLLVEMAEMPVEEFKELGYLKMVNDVLIPHGLCLIAGIDAFTGEKLLLVGNINTEDVSMFKKIALSENLATEILGGILL